MAPQSRCQAVDQAIRPDMVIQIFLTEEVWVAGQDTWVGETGSMGQLSRMRKWAGSTWMAGDGRRDRERGANGGVEDA